MTCRCSATISCCGRWLHLPAVQPYYQFSGLLLLVLPVAFGALAYINKRPGQVGLGGVRVVDFDQDVVCAANGALTAACLLPDFGLHLPQVSGGDDIY